MADYVNTYIKKKDHNRLLLESGIRPHLNYSNYSMTHWAILPQYKGITHIVGVSGVVNNKTNMTNYELKYRFSKNLSSTQNIDLAGLLTMGKAEQNLVLTLSKEFSNGIQLSATSKLTESNISFSNFVVQKKFEKDLSGYSSLNFDDEMNLLTGLTKEWEDSKIKLDNRFAFYMDKIRISNTLSKKINSKLQYFGELNTVFLNGSFIPQVALGYTYHTSSTSKFTLSSIFAANAIGLEFKYSRLKFKFGLPISLSQGFDLKTGMFSLAVTGCAFYLSFLYDKFRRTSKKYLAKLERKKSARTEDSKREFASLVEALFPESNRIVLNELPR